MTESKVPEIYNGIAAVLKALSVAKNGQLPGNMGSGAYITAVDLSAEVKRQFVAANLVIFPSERVTKHDVIDSGNRKMVVIGVEGTYKIVSTVDGSSETISGVGDGTALGTSVASNIASTNSLKNALLRTFLVTEQSVEDQAKRGDDTEDTAPKAVQQARNAPQVKQVQQRANAAKGNSHQAIKDKYINNPDSKIELADVKVVIETVQKEGKSAGKWQSGAEMYDEVLRRLEMTPA